MPVRSAITGAMVGVAGVVAGLVFVSSLDRLITSPARSAIPFDVGIADITKEDLEGRCWTTRSSATCPFLAERACRGRGPRRVERARGRGSARLPRHRGGRRTVAADTG